MEIIKKSILKKVYKKRKKWSHKDDFGRLVIIGGNEKYSGSPALNALAALSAYRTGVDIVEVIAPKRAADIIAKFSPDIITYPLKGNFLKKQHLKILLRESENKKAFVIGGGIGRKKESLSTIQAYLKKIKIKGVIDADAIYALSDSIDLENFVLTPHSYEFYILTKEKVENNVEERIKKVKKWAKKLNTTILLKGYIDVIADKEKVAINKTGTSYMTVGGTGDVLAGILGSLIAQGNSLFLSACAASYINGKAAELTKKKVSLIATDLIDKISEVVDKI